MENIMDIVNDVMRWVVVVALLAAAVYLLYVKLTGKKNDSSAPSSPSSPSSPEDMGKNLAEYIKSNALLPEVWDEVPFSVLEAYNWITDFKNWDFSQGGLKVVVREGLKEGAYYRFKGHTLVVKDNLELAAMRRLVRDLGLAQRNSKDQMIIEL